MKPQQVESIAERLEQLGYAVWSIRRRADGWWGVLLGDSIEGFHSARLSVALSEALLWAEANPRT